MDSLIGKYIGYISGIRRYSERTCDIYHESLLEFARYVHGTETGDISPEGEADEEDQEQIESPAQPAGPPPGHPPQLGAEIVEHGGTSSLS